MFEDYSQDQINSWIAPEELQLWQLAIYKDKFNATFASYEQHFKAAIRHVNPSHISSARMEYVARECILARMRGEVPMSDTKDAALCKDRVSENYTWWK